MNDKKEKSKINRIKFYIFMILIFGALIIFILNARHFKGKVSIKMISDIIRRKGAFASVVYLAVFAVKPLFVILPSNVIAVAAGNVFGSFNGFILTMIGYFISATVAFYLSRFLGRSFVEDIVGKKMVKLDSNLEENGFKILFLLRLPPILPYDALSYTCGLTRIRYRDFISATLLGVIPETICYSMLGKSYRNPLSIKFIFPIIILVLGLVFAKKIMNKK